MQEINGIYCSVCPQGQCLSRKVLWLGTHRLGNVSILGYATIFETSVTPPEDFTDEHYFNLGGNSAMPIFVQILGIMKEKPLILICNDDGITAPGIRTLIEVAQEFGEVYVVAPDSPQSGMGHAITIGEPLRLKKEDLGGDIKAWACSGTPVDCVKLATGVVLPRKPDLLVSGINHGPNHSISVVYSGTMSAAMEGAIEGIPSIGFSLYDFRHDADFSAAAEIVRIVIKRAMHVEMPSGTLLNVNIPKLALSEIKGIKITRQAIGRWVENFDERKDPMGRTYYWLTGKFLQEDDGQDTDVWALENGYVSVCPVTYDLTAHHALPILNQWNLHLD